MGSDARITMILSVSGQGDNGYNDLITQSIMRFYNHHEVSLSMQHPYSLGEAKELVKRWLALQSDKKELLVLSADYVELADSEIRTLADNQKVLLFEARRGFYLLHSALWSRLPVGLHRLTSSRGYHRGRHARFKHH